MLRRLLLALVALTAAFSCTPRASHAQAQPLPTLPAVLPALSRGWCGVTDTTHLKVIAQAADSLDSRRASLVGLPSEIPVKAYIVLRAGVFDSTGTRTRIATYCVGRLQRVASYAEGVRYDLYLPPKTARAKNYSKQWSAYSDSLFAYRDSLMQRAVRVGTPPEVP